MVESVQVRMYLVDAFTSRPFAGNTAGVVTNADDLSSESMQAIAAELRQTETCFVSQQSQPDTDFDLRWFTPTTEVNLCGHATVAAFICLANEGRIAWDRGVARLRCGTRVGMVPVIVTDVAGESPRVALSAGVAPMRPASDDPTLVAEAVGLPPSVVDPNLPLAFDESSERIIIPVKHLSDLLALQPDITGMMAYGKHSAYRRYTLFCQETADPNCTLHVRHFAPANGIPEDPVTGTAHAAVAAYLDWQGQLPGGDVVTIQGEQGHAVGRPGLVGIHVIRRAGQVTDIRIAGTGAIVANGTLTMP